MGSEMCIRDSLSRFSRADVVRSPPPPPRNLGKLDENARAAASNASLARSRALDSATANFVDDSTRILALVRVRRDAARITVATRRARGGIRRRKSIFKWPKTRRCCGLKTNSSADRCARDAMRANDAPGRARKGAARWTRGKIARSNSSRAWTTARLTTMDARQLEARREEVRDLERKLAAHEKLREKYESVLGIVTNEWNAANAAIDALAAKANGTKKTSAALSLIHI